MAQKAASAPEGTPFNQSITHIKISTCLNYLLLDYNYDCLSSCQATSYKKKIPIHFFWGGGGALLHFWRARRGELLNFFFGGGWGNIIT